MNMCKTLINRWGIPSIFLLLLLINQQSAAQCVFVSITAPKCAGDGIVQGVFSRTPFQIDWRVNDSIIQSSTVTWTTLAVTPISGSITASSQQKITGTQGLAIDNNGAILISDTIRSRVVAFDKNNPDGLRIVGGNGTGSASNQINKPAGIFIDAFGNLFVTDQYNNRILRFAPGSSNGFLVAGGNGRGNGLAQLNNPKDVYVDEAGFVYIADEGNHRIVKWAQGGGIGQLVAGGFGSGNDSTHLNSPQGVCVDKQFNVYVADSANHRIQKFVPGSFKGITVLGGYGRGAFAGQLNKPIDVLVDAFQNIYALDAGNHRVQRITANGFQVTTLAGSTEGLSGSENDRLKNPSAIAFDASGNLFVLDQENGRVQQLSIIPIGTSIVPFIGGRYTAVAHAFSGCSQTSNTADISSTPPIEVIGKSAICVGELTEIKLRGAANYSWTPATGVSKLNDSTYLIKADSTTFYGVNATNSSGCISFTSATITVGTRSLPFITATNCVSPDASKITARLTGAIPANLTWYRSGANTAAATLFPEWTGVSNSVAGGNGMGNTSAQLNLPMGSFVDAKGNIYIADAVNHRIQLWKPGDLIGTTIAGGKGEGNASDQLNYPTGVYVDFQGNIYVADQNNHRIQYFPAGSTKGNTVAGGSGAGSSSFQLNFPTSIYVDAFGNIYIADAGNHRVQKWGVGARSVKTVAGNGIPGNDNLRLNNPQSVFVDQNSNLFIADAGNHRIIYFRKDSLFGFPVAGNNGIGNRANQLNSPTGIAVDATGNMYIADRGNNRIQRWALFDSVGYTVAGSANGSGGSALNQLQLPAGIAFDNIGAMYVTDSRNNRVQKFTVGTAIDTVLQTRIPGAYTLLASSFSGCVTGSPTANLAMAPTLKIKASATTICEGSAAILKVSGAGNYKWTPALGLNFTDKDSIVSAPSNTTQYTVASLPVDGCSAAADVIITVSKQPKMNIIGQNCIGGGELNLTSVPRLKSATWFLNDSLIKTTNALLNKRGITVAGGLIGGTDSTKFGRPTFVFVDQQSVLYICDQWNHRIQKWMPGAKIGITVAGGKGAGSNANQLKNPTGIYVDSKGVVYIADTENDRIQKWMPGDTTGTTIAGGKGRGIAADQLSYPTSVFVDPYNNIYIADALNARIQLWEPGSIKGKTVAGGNFSGAAANQLSVPTGVFVDHLGNIFIADTQNDRIQKWMQGDVVGTTVAGGAGKGDNLNQTNAPVNVFMDGSNQLYITEGGTAHRVKKWTIGATAGEIIAGGMGLGVGAEQLNSPGNAMLDPNGNLYITDMNNFRVQQLAPTDTLFALTPFKKGLYKSKGESYGGCMAETQIFKVDSGFIPSNPTVFDIQYCLRDSARKLGAVGDSLRWYNSANGGVGSSLSPLPNTAVIGSTDYWVARINNAGTCESVRKKINVKVNPLPGATITLKTKPNILPGDTATLIASADLGRNISKVLWYRNGSLLNTLPDSLKELHVFFGTVGSYYVKLVDTNLCSTQSNTIAIRADIAINQTIYLFPNPVQDIAKIIFTPIANNTTYLKVVSSTGLVMINRKITTNNTGNTLYELDVSQLPKGVYNVEIVTGVGKVIGSKRVVKL